MRSAVRISLAVVLMGGIVMFVLGAVGFWRWGAGPSKLGVVLDIHEVMRHSRSVSDAQAELQRVYGSGRVKTTQGESAMLMVTAGGRRYLAALPCSDAVAQEVVACNCPSGGGDADYILGFAEGGISRFRCQIPPVPGCLVMPSEPDFVQYPPVAGERVRAAYPDLWDKLRSMEFRVKQEPARDAESGEGR